MTRRALRVQVGEPSAIDPGRAFEHDGALIAGLLADPLVDCDPATGRLAPAAADGWQVAPDGLSIRFRLRPDVRFHHGRPVTAQDYRYSLSRVVRPETESALAHHLSAVEGYCEVAAGTSRLLSGVQILTDHQLLVRLTLPFHEIAAVFSHRVTAAVPAELVEADPAAFARRPVSTGPYAVVEEWRPGHGLAVEQFAGYHGANGAYPDGGAGQARRIEFRIHHDLDQAYRAFARGELDVTEVAPDLLGEAAASGPAFHCTPNPMVTYLGFPLPVAPFDDPVVRRAVAMCVDRETIGKRHFAGTRPVADRIVPPMTGPAALPPGTAIAHRPSLHITYDPDGARKLLTERGITPPGAVRVLFNAGQGHEGWVSDVIRGIRDGLGWRVEGRRLDWPAYLRELPQATTLFRMNWTVDYLSADNALHPLAHSAAVGDSNYARYRNPRVDALIDGARATADATERRTRYRQAEQLVLDDLPFLPLWQGALYHLVAPDRVRPLGPPMDVFGVPALRQYRPLDPAATAPGTAGTPTTTASTPGADR
ncbi:ABC transporter substrate-binding protein [Kitasatospora mediocidica]|uniref:ABC transporter substrate-binding protein n=1 Tax=Kitasatospora mediocidica TaxID=58352 RepID=UPI00056672E3|nr:ABC transporter substrate-binding protein [Kitasatospora mediocidica]